jgi:hypothetical protein
VTKTKRIRCEKGRDRGTFSTPLCRGTRVSDGAGHVKDQVPVARAVKITTLAVTLVVPTTDFVYRIDGRLKTSVSDPTMTPVRERTLRGLHAGTRHWQC